MNLLATARALDDDLFRWRVAAACFIHAQGYASMPAGPPKNFAITVLLNPQSVDESMVGFVSADDAVSNAITVNPGNGAVDTSNVTDADIQRVVVDKWSLVAVKYQTNPLGG